MTERALTTSSYIVLGLLATHDWTAYQLAEQVGRGLDPVWPTTDRQRYNTLKRLRERHLVVGRAEKTGERSRTVYAITDAGRSVLAQWLSRPVRPPALQFEAGARVVFAAQGRREDLRRTLELTRDQALARRALLTARADPDTTDDGSAESRRDADLVETFLLGQADHVIAWATWALEELATWPPPEPRETSEE
ncbi:PadR family transcriptional regulator [Microbacterium sp. SLBN-146]|uniref:PadR family transcriptional regulator n=1 Tax=Microbacterium sp. SLBN-146 TaxID=2768457 RepID=UPI0013595E08|nr:PadR family transcriptional regulator [Microbacterium sp. SLBN-146]